jgi:hypothetical protein
VEKNEPKPTTVSQHTALTIHTATDSCASLGCGMDRYQNLGIKASIFGDPLGNRGEYSKGIFYSGRRRYLYNENSQLPPMEPPRDMMTNKQVTDLCLLDFHWKNLEKEKLYSID